MGGRLFQARRLEGRLLTLRPGIPPAEPLRLGDRPASTLPLRGGGGERQSPGMAQSSRAGWAGFPQEQARDQPGRLPVETEQSEIWELAMCKRRGDSPRALRECGVQWPKHRVFSSVRAPVCPQPWTGVLGPPHAPGCLSLVLSLKLPADLIWGLVQDPHTWLAGSISLITSPTPLFSILISLSLPPCLCLCCLSLSVPVSVSHLFVSVSPIPPCLSLSQSLGSISPTHLTTLVHPKIAPLDRSAQGAPWS